jgi:hypothetical protein
MLDHLRILSAEEASHFRDQQAVNSRDHFAPTHKKRRVAEGKDANVGHKGSADRPITRLAFNTCMEKLPQESRAVYDYDATKKQCWCGACGEFVRDDNIGPHDGTKKHKRNIAVYQRTLMMQTNLRKLVVDSSTLSARVLSRALLLYILYAKTLAKTLLNTCQTCQKRNPDCQGFPESAFLILANWQDCS